MSDSLIVRIDAILPQTQCGQCGYLGCKPYAEAIAAKKADINQCPPGGIAGIHALADLLGMDYKPLNPLHGEHKAQLIAVIDESRCIGCTLCIQACPVDAILGASKHMHTVIAAECTGCELCIAPCPVDCIDLKPLQDSADNCQTNKQTKVHSVRFNANVARQRYEYRLFRMALNKKLKRKRGLLHSSDAMPIVTENAQIPKPINNDQQAIDMKKVSSLAGNDAKKSAIAAAMAKVTAMKTHDPLQQMPTAMASASSVIIDPKPNRSKQNR